jgi:tetratricopeptide (TPR) repeat protein
MNRNIRGIAISIVILSALIMTSCSAKYAGYSHEIFVGKNLFQEKDYEKAKQYFIQASKDQYDSVSLALLGSAYYKTGDIGNAERTILEAEKIDKNSDYFLRILGYKSLVLLKQNKPEGFDALRQYVKYVKQQQLPMEMHEFERMIENNKVDLAVLESKIEEQASWYEDEMRRLKNNEPGYFSEKYGHQ